jgi:spermidine synthase
VKWTHTVRGGRGDDIVIIGQPGPTRVDVEALNARFDGPAYADVKVSLREIGIKSTIDLFAGYSGQKAELAPWLADAQINRDRNLRLQYLAGMGKYSSEVDDIYLELDGLKKFPASLFVASDAWKDELRRALDSARVPRDHSR